MTSQYSLLSTVVRQRHTINQLSWSHLGVLSPAATRMALGFITGPRDIWAMDMRSITAMNGADVFGYDQTTMYILELAGQYRAGGERPADLMGLFAADELGMQYGGDEFLYVTAPGQGLGLMMRHLRKAASMTLALPAHKRAKLAEKTGGKCDGFNIAGVLIEGSTNLTADVIRAFEGVARLKMGKTTGDRNTTGSKGTHVARMRPSPRMAA